MVTTIEYIFMFPFVFLAVIVLWLFWPALVPLFQSFIMHGLLGMTTYRGVITDDRAAKIITRDKWLSSDNEAKKHFECFDRVWEIYPKKRNI